MFIFAINLLLLKLEAAPPVSQHWWCISWAPDVAWALRIQNQDALKDIKDNLRSRNTAWCNSIMEREEGQLNMSECQWRDTGKWSIISEFSLRGEIAEADVGSGECPSRHQEPCVQSALRNHHSVGETSYDWIWLKNGDLGRERQEVKLER